MILHGLSAGQTGRFAFRTCLAAAVLPLALLAQTPPAADEAAAPTTTAKEQHDAPTAAGEPQKLEAFVVTGSNIKRVDEEKMLPVSTFDTEDIDVRAAATPAEFFEYLPQAGEMPINEESTLGASARGDVASISLRSLGSANTLVLVNGRRMVPHPVSQAESGVPSLAVNINSLPSAAIKRIEILRDGASAIYGADATAGVVNAILNTDADGTKLKVQGSVTQDGGGAERRFTISDGRMFKDDRGKIRVSFDYLHRDAIMSSDRTFSANSDNRDRQPAPFNGVPITLPDATSYRNNNFDNTASSSSIYGNFIRGKFQADPVTGEQVFVGSRPDSNRGIATTSNTTALTTASNTAASPGQFYLLPLADGTIGTTSSQPTHSIENYAHNYYYNVNQDRQLVPETRRFQFAVTLDHDVTGDIKAFGELFYYHADSWLYRDPVSVDSTGATDIYVPATNPYNPFGTRFYDPAGAPNADGTPRIVGTPAAVLFAPGTGVQPRDFRRRAIEVNSRVGRAVAGFRGRIFGDWEWESALLYGWGRTEDVEHYDIRDSRLREALARTDATAFNPFGVTFKNVGGTIRVDQVYHNDASVVNPLYDDFVRLARTSLASWDAKVNGPLFEAWGRQVSAAAGVELRRETYEDWRPPYAGLNPAGSSSSNPYLIEGENDFVGLSPNVNLSTSRDAFAGFTEVLVPIVRAKDHVPGIRALEFSLAGRYERFSDFGDTFKPKYSVGYRPNSWILLRGSYSESFRAPNLVQVDNTPLQRLVSSITDYYRVDVTALGSDGSRTRKVTRQGNAALKPEEADTVAIGLVVEVPKVKGLTVSADYWSMKQRNVIANLGATLQMQIDSDMLDAATQAQLAAGKTISDVVVQDGTHYLGNPRIHRAPITGADLTAFANYNATHAPSDQRAPVGKIATIIDDYLNLDARNVGGIDFSLQYRLPRLPIGQFTLRGEGAWMNQYDQMLASEGGIMRDRLGLDGITRWKANASLIWRWKQWGAGWFTNYVMGSIDTSANIGLASSATTQAVLQALNYPDYLRPYMDSTGSTRIGYRVGDWISHNAYVNYKFSRRKAAPALRDVSVRVGVNNVFGIDPPFADETRGYRTSAGSPRGRQYYLQLSKQL
ncbi:TonB-dependent receptor [Horticoccus luteus]|uniref:TonB-dependent receptor n=1 Tax=Horticoccus luteus TaxID=2862869 RepID=A0A8F9XFW4_9BACT|nr:TonB-dependent receptor [Horticoccus luteus]QYM78517.1 TonB-dependent receptor [Horticoccus luteus]